MKPLPPQSRRTGAFAGKVLPITDGDLIRRVVREQARRGDSTPTKTATKLILERLTLLEEPVVGFGSAVVPTSSLPSPS